MPLEVIIAGAGIGGLCAAVALRQAGHSVKIFEKSRFAAEIGAAVALSPNGTRVLSALGFDWQSAKPCEMQYWEIMDGITRQQLSCLDFSDSEARYGGRAVTIHRVDLHKELLRLALEGEDNPASLKLASTVEAVDEQGYVTLNDGTKLHADLIVGADGVHSTTRKTVLNGELQAPAATDVSAFRLLIPTKKLKDQASESLSGLLKAKVQGSTLIADTSEKVKERHIIWYGCRGGEVQNIVGIYPTRFSEDPSSGKSVSNTSYAEDVSCWRLAYYEPFSHWTLHNIALIGDAAHPMLPFSGQAANQAMEDAGALGALFKGVNTSAEVSQRLQIFENVKRNRTAMIQVLSSARAGLEYTVADKLRQYAEPGSEIPKSHGDRTHFAYSFDVFRACEDALQSSQS
ncbi:MAG: hypothetical protein Q9191_000477 [Dirinaria sp. TL-2023a]